MKTQKQQKIDFSKTPKEKAHLANEKARWRKKCQSHYDGWTKRLASRVNNGKRRMNPTIS